MKSLSEIEQEMNEIKIFQISISRNFYDFGGSCRTIKRFLTQTPPTKSDHNVISVNWQHLISRLQSGQCSESANGRSKHYISLPHDPQSLQLSLRLICHTDSKRNVSIFFVSQVFQDF